MVRYDTYCDTGITIRYVSRYIYYPLIYEMQNYVTEVPIRIYYNIWGNTYHDTIFSLAIRIMGAVYRYIVIHWWIVTSLKIDNKVGIITTLDFQSSLFNPCLVYMRKSPRCCADWTVEQFTEPQWTLLHSLCDNFKPRRASAVAKRLCLHLWGEIKNNAWVTVNNDFWVTSEAICQWFSRVTKSRVKIIGKSHNVWPKNRYSR